MSNRYAVNKTKFLLEPEQDELLKILKRNEVTSPRDCTLLYFLLFTGARPSEALMLKPADLNRYEESVLIQGLKGSNDREIPLPSWLFKLVATEAAKGSGPVFDISYNRLRQIWQLYRPVNKKLHGLRHTFAINLFKRTKDLRLVQVALGHRNINNTLVYADYIYSQEELRRVLVA